MDSSVIFLVIIALWAAYLVPHWLRRREQLSASRSVDKFSAAMRVLARRSEVAVAERRPTGRSYVLMPPRETVRDVAVKRSRPVDLSGTSVRETPGESRSKVPPNQPRTVLPFALFLLALVAAVPVLAGLALVDVVPAWAAGPPLLGAAGAVVTLRTAAVRRRAAARPARPTRPAPTPTIKELPVDQGTPDRPVAAAAQAGEAAPPAPGSWTPVPVPPPTYTLKPQAPPRRHASLPEPTPVSEPVAPVAEFDLDAVLQSRRASGE